MGRAQRRKAARQNEANKVARQLDNLMNAKKRQLILDGSLQAGIPPDVYQDIYNKGWNDCVKDCKARMDKMSSEVTVTNLQMVCVALHNSFGFGKNRLMKMVKDSMNALFEVLIDADSLKRQFDKLGIYIDPSDPIEPCKEVLK